MLNFFTITAAALSLTIGTAQAGEPVEAPATPVTTQPVRVLTGTVIEVTGGSDMHGGWVEVRLTGMPIEQSTTFSDIVFPHSCTEPGNKFYIVFEGTSTAITCGEPTK